MKGLSLIRLYAADTNNHAKATPIAWLSVLRFKLTRSSTSSGATLARLMVGWHHNHWCKEMPSELVPRQPARTAWET